MGKRKTLHTISISEVSQQPVELECPIEKRPSSSTSSEIPLQQHSTLCEADNVRCDHGLPKKVQSHTRKQAIWDLESNERILVTFDETAQPVGDEGKELTSFLGTLVKMPQHISLEYKDWRKVPEHKLEDLLNIIRGKFSFAPSETEAILKWIKSDMSTKFKSWKHELKTQSYDPSLSIDEIVATQNDSRVNKVQFKELVTYWLNEKTQMESEMKKKIRSKSNEPHVTGTKSFARLIHEERMKNDGIRPSRGTIYRISRTCKDGRIVNAQASQVVDKLKSIVNESTGSTESGVIDWKNDDLAKVKGLEKGGRIRCMGKVVMANEKVSSSSQDPQVPLLKAHVIELQDKMKAMNERQQAEMKEMKEKQQAEIKILKQNQEAIVRFMTIFKQQLPHATLSNIFNGLNTQVGDDSYSVHNQCPNGNATSSRVSEAHTSES